MSKRTNRRYFVKFAGDFTAAAIFSPAVVTAQAVPKRYAIGGTGHRGTRMWSKNLVERRSDEVQFIGLCDKNIKRVETGRKLIGAVCATFTVAGVTP